MKVAMSEVFGPTFQGEGPSTGKQAMFARLAMCNLKCSWCDTKYTWDWKGEAGPAYRKDEQVQVRELDDVCNELADRANWADLLVITGGEPMLQQRAAGLLAYEWIQSGYGAVEVETNGTIPLDLGLWAWHGGSLHFNVSPKLAHSGNPESKALTDALLGYSSQPNVRFKFVCKSLADLDEVEILCDIYRIDVQATWIMPLGTTPFDVHVRQVHLADEVLRRGFNLTSRMHVELWGDVRGR